MTVYVDESIFPYRGQKYCHMYSPDVEELHRMARAIGLKHAWFQNKRGEDFPHYDLAPSKREAAIKAGATAVTCHEMATIVRGGNNRDN